MTVIPDHPFLVHSIRIAFAAGTGHARIRLERSYGRSSPASALPVSDTGGDDIIPPVDVEVTTAGRDTYMDIDVSAAGAVLQPGVLYHIVYEHLTSAPYVALETVPAGADNNALLFFPDDINAYGLPGNFRMKLEGQYACALSADDRSFRAASAAVFDGRASGNVHIVDLDGDGHDDIVAPGGDHPFAYLGDGHGAFTLTPTSPFPSDENARTMLFGDLDNDGDEDALHAFRPSRRRGTPTPRRSAATLPQTGGGCRKAPRGTQLQDNVFFRNNGDSTFTNVAAAIHVDHDGVPTQSGAAYPGGHSYGGDFGDFDGDGNFDAILCNLSHPRTMPWADPTVFVINQGPPNFDYVDRREQVGIEYNEGDGNAQFGDFDNDGDLDLYIASFYGRYLRVLRNDAGHFLDVTYESGIHGRSGTGVWSDLDADGDLDFVTADNSTTLVYLNQLHGTNHWAEFLLESTTPGVNRDAVGARISVVAGGHTYLRDVRLTGGLVNRQPSRWMHVGLGTNAAIDSVSIRWPGGVVEPITGVSPDRRFYVRQGTGVAAMR